MNKDHPGDDARAKRLLRQNAEAAIEHLILLVDNLDGDSDLEDDGDLEETGDEEPSLGAGDDREAEHDGREPDVDDEFSGDEHEPELGSFDRFTNQDHGWRQAKGRNLDLHTNNDLEADPSMA